MKPFLLAAFSFVLFIFISLMTPHPALALMYDSGGGGGSGGGSLPDCSVAGRWGGYCVQHQVGDCPGTQLSATGCPGGYVCCPNSQPTCSDLHGACMPRFECYGSGTSTGNPSCGYNTCCIFPVPPGPSVPQNQTWYNSSICNGNSIINCGAWTKGTYDRKYWNGDGLHSGSNIRSIYNCLGITDSLVNSSDTVEAYTTFNGNVYLANGTLIATNAQSGGRYWLSGATGQCGIWFKPNSRVFLAQRIDIYAHVVNGVFQWAVMKPCGNVVLAQPVATPTPTPIPTYTITGYVFNDTNKNRLKDNRSDGFLETKDWSGAITVTTTGGSISIDSNTNAATGPLADANAGRFVVSNVIAGTYTISYTSALPTSPITYQMIYPRNGPPPRYSVTVGPACAVDTTTGATCSLGNINNLHFAISNSIPWFQTYGLDMRIDDGFNDIIPANPLYPSFASVADNANGSSNLVTPTPTPTNTPTPTPVPPTRTPTPVPPTATPTSVPGVGAGCNAYDSFTGNHFGTCLDRNVSACSTYYDAGNFCPGGANVQCCVTNQQACRSVGRCHNRYVNGGSYTYACTQNWYSGVCPGPFDVQCCAP